MGVLAQAKNGDKQFWNIEISCSQWEGSQLLTIVTYNCYLHFLEGAKNPIKNDGQNP
jgi:hypothetical protein